MTSAAILAGGLASRFGGRDKSALVVGGRTILERQLTELSAVTDDVFLVGAARDRSDPGSRGVRIVADRVPHRGPLGGLEAALGAARHELVILLACDMPFVTAPFLAHLVALAAGSDIVVPRTGRGYHPLCAVYNRACRPAVLRRLEEGRLAVRDLFDDVRVRVV